MANNNGIETNPEVLRSVASSIIAYGHCQCDIISEYLHQMSSLSQEIEIEGFQMSIEAIAEWSRRMEEIKADGEHFAQFLNDKANYLDSLHNSK